MLYDINEFDKLYIALVTFNKGYALIMLSLEQFDIARKKVIFIFLKLRGPTPKES